jgi:hypothetical protein
VEFLVLSCGDMDIELIGEGSGMQKNDLGNGVKG